MPATATFTPRGTLREERGRRLRAGEFGRPLRSLPRDERSELEREEVARGTREIGAAGVALGGDFDGAALFASQDAVQVEQDDQALGQLGDAVQILGIDARNYGARWLDRGGAYAQDFADAVDDD